MQSAYDFLPVKTTRPSIMDLRYVMRLHILQKYAQKLL